MTELEIVPFLPAKNRSLLSWIPDPGLWIFDAGVFFLQGSGVRMQGQFTISLFTIYLPGDRNFFTTEFTFRFLLLPIANCRFLTCNPQPGTFFKPQRAQRPRWFCLLPIAFLYIKSFPFRGRGKRSRFLLLFNMLRENNMLVERKRAYAKTTNSYHHFHKYNNLIKELEITKPNQVWVSDITYIRTVKGFCYLALITDL